MTVFTPGQIVTLKNNRSMKGIIIGITGSNEGNRYQVFTASTGVQSFKEHQLMLTDGSKEHDSVPSSMFHAHITAFLVRHSYMLSIVKLSTRHYFNCSENYWLTDRMVLNLLDSYLKNRFSKTHEYYIDKEGHLNISLTKEEKQKVFMDYKQNTHSKIKNIPQWESWLKTLTPCVIKRFKDYWDNNSDGKNEILSLQILKHPLLTAAAGFLYDKDRKTSVFKINTTEILAGEYPFSIYSWHYQYEHAKMALKIYSDNPYIQENMLRLLDKCHGINALFNSEHESICSIHEKNEQALAYERRQYHKVIRTDIRLRKEAVTNEHNSYLSRVSGQLYHAKDLFLRNLKIGQIKSLEQTYDLKINELNLAEQEAGIHSSLLVSGIIIVTP